MTDDVPRSVLRAARRAFDQREPRAEVADLVHDSDVLTLIPTDRTPRHLRFATAQLQVDVDVLVTGPTLHLEVAVQPPSPVAVEVRHAGTRLTGRSAADGRCELDGVLPGLVSLLLRPAGQDLPRTQTSWTRL